MKYAIEKLLRHRKVFYSQNGEDGFLRFVLSRMPDKTGWCVEFGAWDGKSESNTHYFITQQGYHGIMIEADPRKYHLLCENMKPHGTICINSFVRPEGENSLDSNLSLTSCPKEFDLLSIDVDGDDYYIWQSLRKYRPRVVIIEINSRFKPGVRCTNKQTSPIVQNMPGSRISSMCGISGYKGTSISSMTDLAISKGYSLLANIKCNAIYVRSEYLNIFYDREVTPDEVFTYEDYHINELSFIEIRKLLWKKILEWRSRSLGRMFPAL